MKGIEAIALALHDSDVRRVTGVPGFPITKLMEHIELKEQKKEWCVNEKVALEMALGSSVTGERSAVITKHVGMNVLADPLVSSVTHTIGAGVVIIAGDDPGALQSQNEQDSRFYGLLAEVPVFDPPTPEIAYKSITHAFELSEKLTIPVIVRVTQRLMMMEGNIDRRKTVSHQSFDKRIWLHTMKGKHQRFHKLFSFMQDYAEHSKLNVYKKKSKVGIISSGYPSHLVDSMNVSHLSLGVVNPLPINLINRFIDEHERVLVVEETEPVIEKQISKVLGKLTGHMPYGRVEVKHIKNALENIHKDNVTYSITPETIKRRGSHPLCEDCPYLPLYEAIKELKELNIPVAGDLGCCILASAPPLSIIDAAFSLGSAIGTASGFNRKGIAITGDFGFAHSGICGLINAVYNNHDILVIVLQNEVSAMTGGQKVPDLTEIIKACVEDTEILYRFDKIKNILNNKLAKKGISVILARARCPRY